MMSFRREAFACREFHQKYHFPYLSGDGSTDQLKKGDEFIIIL